MSHHLRHLAIWLGPVLAALMGAAAPDEKVVLTMPGGRKVNAEVFKPASGGPHPAVVVAYGTAGMDGAIGDALRDFAGALRDAGLVAVIPDHFGATGTAPGEAALRDFPARRDEWVAILAGTLGAANDRADVARGDLGLVGFSMGAHLALRAAKSPAPARAKAVVDFSGPTTLFGGIGDGLDKLPATQIHHGQRDTIVPPGDSAALDALLTTAKVPHELWWYKDEGHVPFTKAGTDLSTARTVDFLRQNLR